MGLLKSGGPMGAAFRTRATFLDRPSPRLHAESCEKTGHIQGRFIAKIPREVGAPTKHRPTSGTSGALPVLGGYADFEGNMKQSERVEIASLSISIIGKSVPGVLSLTWNFGPTRKGDTRALSKRSPSTRRSSASPVASAPGVRRATRGADATPLTRERVRATKDISKIDVL